MNLSGPSPEGDRRRWRDAWHAAGRLTPEEQQLLRLVGQLPLARADVLSSFTGRRRQVVYGALQKLTHAGLIDAIRPSLWPWRQESVPSPRLFYPTDLGLATHCLLEPHTRNTPSAQWSPWRRDRLLATLPGIAHLAAAHELLGALAASRAGTPCLVAWAYPWRGTVHAPWGQRVGASFPAAAVLAWDSGSNWESADDRGDGGDGEDRHGREQDHGTGKRRTATTEEAMYLLLPDVGTAPTRAFRRTLDQLLVLRDAVCTAWTAPSTHPRAGPPGTPPSQSGDAAGDWGANGLPSMRLSCSLTGCIDREAGRPFPRVVVATTDESRAWAWKQLLETVREARGEAPLDAHVITWDTLHELRTVPAGTPPSTPGGATSHQAQTTRRASAPPESPAQRHLTLDRQPGSSAVPLDGTLPGTVGPPLAAVDTSGGPGAFRAEDWRSVRTSPGRLSALGAAALTLTTTDRRLLDLLARHPFLSVADMADVYGWSPRWARFCLDRLRALGLVQWLEDAQVGTHVAEPTLAGLQIAAAQQGLTLGAAVSHNGLAGGGPALPPSGLQRLRRGLWRRLAHTRATDAVFVDLIATARRLAAAGTDDALIAWRNAAACRHGGIYPDGYGEYRRDGQRYGFFLELDRGTENRANYRRKLEAYYEYLERGGFGRDYAGFPTILVVTTNTPVERRIAELAREAALAREQPLPLLLTCTFRIRGERGMPPPPDGFLASIWRTAESPKRRSWLPQASHDAGQPAA